MCIHLEELEKYLKQQNIKETFRGKAWDLHCREWIYFDCYLNIEKLRLKFDLPKFIIHHFNDDIRSGLEEGFVCTECNDGIIALNRKFKKSDSILTVVE